MAPVHLVSILALIAGLYPTCPLAHQVELEETTQMERALKSSAHRSWALLIDAGSTGSRMHLYEWAPRIFDTIPPPISKPVTSERWTERMRPGISVYAEDPGKAADALVPLIEFAMRELSEYEHNWHTFPIFLKATAGMRELSLAKREGIMASVRQFLSDNSTCPFLFKHAEQARVIAGEEEAAYAWAGVNFVTGALLDSSSGSGTAQPKKTFGSLEMGGGSAQIAFYRPEQNILANLFKLQIGDSKHWNVYAHSFLQFGHVSGQDRMWSQIAMDSGCFHGTIKDSCEIVDACLPAGYVITHEDDLKGRPGLHPPLTHEPMYFNMSVKPKPQGSNWDECLAQVSGPLGFTGALKDQYNAWCNFSHSGECSFAGTYQPELPDADGPFGQFMLIGGYVDLWDRLGLNGTAATLEELEESARHMCSLDDATLMKKFRPKNDREETKVRSLCFLAAFSFSMLHHGHGFRLDRTFTAYKKMNYLGSQLKVGWQLGSILYEINSLPWELELDEPESPKTLATFGSVTAVCAALAVLVCVYTRYQSSSSTIASERQASALITSPTSQNTRSTIELKEIHPQGYGAVPQTEN